MLLCPIALLPGNGQFKRPKPEVSPSRQRRRNDSTTEMLARGCQTEGPIRLKSESVPASRLGSAARCSGQLVRMVVSPLRQRRRPAMVLVRTLGWGQVALPFE
jgi:hypothetical protein